MKELNNIKLLTKHKKKEDIIKSYNIYSINTKYSNINICLLPKYKIITSGLSNGSIYKTKIKSKKYILKVVPTNLKKVKGVIIKDIEYKIYKLIQSKITDKYISQFYCKCYSISKCNNDTYYLFEYIKDDINSIIYKNILVQILLAIYYLNHSVGIYHCDLVLHKNKLSYDPLRLNNIMYNKLSKPIKHTYILDKNIKIKLILSKYLIKIIDFGISKQNTKLLKKKLYHIFNNFPYISEVLYILYIYLYIKVSYKDRLEFNTKFTRFIYNIIEQNKPTSTQEFDSYLIKYIFDENMS